MRGFVETFPFFRNGIHGPRQDSNLRALCADLGFATREARMAEFNYPSLTTKKKMILSFQGEPWVIIYTLFGVYRSKRRRAWQKCMHLFVHASIYLYLNLPPLLLQTRISNVGKGLETEIRLEVGWVGLDTLARQPVQPFMKFLMIQSSKYSTPQSPLESVMVPCRTRQLAHQLQRQLVMLIPKLFQWIPKMEAVVAPRIWMENQSNLRNTSSKGCHRSDCWDSLTLRFLWMLDRILKSHQRMIQSCSCVNIVFFHRHRNRVAGTELLNKSVDLIWRWKGPLTMIWIHI